MRSRVQRLEKTRAARRRRTVIAAAIAGGIGVVAIILGVVLALGSPDAKTVELPETTAATETMAFDETAEETAAVSTPIEVPSVTGMSFEEARALLEVAGFVVTGTQTPSGDVASGTVVAQEPPAGSRVASGIEVALIYAGAAAAPAVPAAPGVRAVVCLDPGHQGRANSATEPLGPGSKEMKAKVSGGAVGVVTRIPEPRLTLKVAVLVKERLEAEGIQVVMTRVTDAVDISNRQRAEVANAAGADLFVRIHADSHTNAALKGVSILYPAGNQWVGPIEAESLKAAEAMRDAVLGATGAADRGIVKRADLTGFNWAKVPSVLVEMGFMSNPVEDELLATEAYQAKLADGIAAGIVEYLER